MYRLVVLVGVVASSYASMYGMPEMKAEQLVNKMLLQDLLARMGSDLQLDEAMGADPYMMDSRESGAAGVVPDKEIPLEMPYDYDGLEPLNPKASIRDQEYLRHSSLWSHHQQQQQQQLVSSYKANERHRVKPGAQQSVKSNDDKNDSQLPAYCTPPNPCPVGYTSENHCIVNFENTAAFSRDYQSAQDCMCDSEHMLECPNSADTDNNVVAGLPITNADFNQIVERFEEENPFFRGEKLPIAAKKGINVGF